MNQILYKCNFENNNNSNNNNNKKHLFIIIVFSIISIFIALLIYFFAKYKLLQNEKISKNLASDFSVITLYSNSIDNYSSKQISNDNLQDPFIIGLIEIDKINLSYPILSTASEELLKISPCRFSGPMPNKVGNLCIAGHNYSNNTQFGKIHYLEINDIIKIYDSSGNKIDYKIYDKKEINSNDLSCTNQETNGLKIVTLITCNNLKGNRICISAKEI